LAAAVERLRLDFPMWGRAKIGPLVRELGFAVSDATVGRILSALIKRRRVPAVSALVRKIGPRSAAKKRPYAVRKPKDVAFEKPGDVVQIDTLSIAILPGRTIKQFTAYDPFAKWTVAKPYKRATAKNAASSWKACARKCPIPSEPFKSTAEASSWPNSSRPAPTPKSPSMSFRRDRQSSTAPSNAATAPGAMSSMPAPTCRATSTRSPSASTPSSTSITTTDPTAPLPV
jgi:hypothetical protein